MKPGNRIQEIFFTFWGVCALIVGIRTRQFALISMGALVVTVFVLVTLARLDLTAPWVRFLWGQRGPNTMVKYMVKDELFRSGLQYLGISAVFAGVFAVTGWLSGRGLSYNLIVLGGFFGSFILFATFFCGGIYMLIRGLFRRKSYEPPEDIGEDDVAPL